MAANSRDEWMTFSDLFAAAEKRGLDCVSLADLLLTHIRHPLNSRKTCGIMRGWTHVSDTSSQLVECHRSLRYSLLPSYIWQDLKRVGADLMSEWIDNGDDPEASIGVDWVAGRVEFFGHSAYLLQGGDDDEWWFNATISALKVEAGLARLLLDPSPNPPDALPPEPPFSDEERQAWIRHRGRQKGGVAAAWEEFQSHPRYDGTIRDVFRAEHKDILKTRDGRPKKAAV